MQHLSNPVVLQDTRDVRDFVARMDTNLCDCINGDPQAWSQFVARFTPLIASAVRRAMGPAARFRPEQVEDRVQEVFLKLLRDDRRVLRSFDPARASIETWLAIIARTTTIDWLRMSKPGAIVLEDAPQIESRETPSDPGSHQPFPASVPLQLLTARQRLVLRLLFEQDMSVPEAARVIGVNEQTIRSTKHKALTRLREHFRTPGKRPKGHEKSSPDDSGGMISHPATY